MQLNTWYRKVVLSNRLKALPNANFGDSGSTLCMYSFNIREIRREDTAAIIAIGIKNTSEIIHPALPPPLGIRPVPWQWVQRC